MAINTISPTTYTTGMIVTDTTNSTNGSRDTIPSNLPLGVAFDVRSINGGIRVPSMTTSQINSLTPQNGTIVYDSTLDTIKICEGGAYVANNPNPFTALLNESQSTMFLGSTRGPTASQLLTAQNSIYIGIAVGQALTTAGDNLIIGTLTGNKITTGSGNVLLGTGSGTNLVTGQFNTLVGVSAGINMILDDSNNTGIGSLALSSGTGMTNCTAIGANAGKNRTSLDGCTFIGFGADADADALTNACAIGAGAVAHLNNSIILGNGCSVGIGTSSPTSTLHVVSAGNAIHVDGAYIAKVTTNAGTPYNIAANDFIVAQTATASAISLVLPAIAAGNTGVMYKIKDQSGSANTHNITISTTGGKTIDGAATSVINTAYGKVNIYNDGTQWYTI